MDTDDDDGPASAEGRSAGVYRSLGQILDKIDVSALGHIIASIAAGGQAGYTVGKRVLLSQAQGDRQILAKQLGISPHQLSYVTHTNSGEGLLFFGNTTIPFVDRFPQNTELYAIMTTRPEDKKQEMNRAYAGPRIDGDRVQV